MISIKPLLPALAICVALLMPEYVLAHFDAWEDAPTEEIFYSVLDDGAGGESLLNACACLPCLVAAPARDAVSDDD